VSGVAPQRIHIMTVYGLENVKLLPFYMNYYVASCGWNAAVADCTIFLVAADHLAASFVGREASSFFDCRPLDNPLPSNVRVVVLPNAEWQRRGRMQLGLKVWGVENMYKMADYKPLYGDIFDDYLPYDIYSHWAYADPDVMFGSIKRFFSFDDDIYVTYFKGGWHEETASGQLTIMRNTGILRHLWQRPVIFGEKVPQKDDQWWILNRGLRLTYSEQGFGKALFGIAASLNLTFSHREESFSDEKGNKGRHWDMWWEKGRVFAIPACFKTPMREGILIHMWAIKKAHGAPGGRLHNCSAWIFPSDRPWDTEPRWNYTHAVNLNNQEKSVSEFHDPLWGHCSRPPCNCPKPKA
jgi:hypothetical protein